MPNDDSRQLIDYADVNYKNKSRRRNCSKIHAGDVTKDRCRNGKFNIIEKLFILSKTKK